MLLARAFAWVRSVFIACEDPGEETTPETDLVRKWSKQKAPLLENYDMTIQSPSKEQLVKRPKLSIVGGHGSSALTKEIAEYLNVAPLKVTIGKFADGETNVQLDESVQGKDVYIIQSTGPPVNDNVMELLLMITAIRSSHAQRITAVIPYYGYGRQDRKKAKRGSTIAAALVANILASVGVDRVIAVDLHSRHIQGFFGPRIPADNLEGGIIGLDYIGKKQLCNPVVVSPDAGGVERAMKFKNGLERLLVDRRQENAAVGLAKIIKKRSRSGCVDEMSLVGNVQDCDCIIVDDMIDSGGTIIKAAELLKDNGAQRVLVFATHGVFSGSAVERLEACQSINEVVILDTLPSAIDTENNKKITVLPACPLLAAAIYDLYFLA